MKITKLLQQLLMEYIEVGKEGLKINFEEIIRKLANKIIERES